MAMIILQVVGYQNSGKTTLIEKLVREFTNRGVKVGTLKHHGHGGKPELPKKDSTRHWEAGALVSAVEGDGTLFLTAATHNSCNLSKLIELYRHFEIDLLLIEGFKNSPYPKIVCIRDECDLHLLQLQNVVASISWVPLNEGNSFFISEEKKYIEWIIQYVKGEGNVCDCERTDRCH
ncbi:molybdopterin-guanine dinucleotide biosynthesis protein B [Bacillus alveayuensis]|uniref:Molybdopterin-guanine dinucleotide biosynthesis protein B n=2 Tax=Aeribacillus alveayuensis TaxID=279215 RepID=A0ABT9VPV2_9BACI|nr:molybdopterin-guanine dinucleotide biosynthesis protein B [Bacillus alveayuensis]